MNSMEIISITNTLGVNCTIYSAKWNREQISLATVAVVEKWEFGGVSVSSSPSTTSL